MPINIQDTDTTTAGIYAESTNYETKKITKNLTE
jgi:hypothetical protein